MKNLKLHLVFFIVCLTASAALAQTTAFNYQGKLSDAGNPASGNYLLQFKLFDAAAGGTQIGATSPDVFVTVSQGVFSTQLDFGATPFTGADRFLEISVKKNAGDPFTVLSPRQQINSSPYSIRTLSAAQADVALDANKLGGVEASEYVTTASVGNSFIKNSTTLQTGANFNIGSNGVVGGSFGIGTTPASGFKLDVNGQAQIRSGGIGSADVIQLSAASSPKITMTSGSSAKGFITFDNLSFKMFAGSGPTFNPDSGITIKPSSGNVGIGTDAPAHRLSLSGGPAWTSNAWKGAVELENTAAIGWQANGGGQRFGIGQSGGGLYFFRTASNPGTTGSPSIYDMVIADSGKVGIGTMTPQAKFHAAGGSSWFQGDSTPLPAAAGKGIVVGFAGEQGYISAFDYGTFTAKNLLLNNSGGKVGIGTATPQAKLQVAGNVAQDINSNGLVKAMIYVDPFLPASQYIVRCYNSLTNQSSNGCGFTVTRLFEGQYRIDFGSGFDISNRFISLTLTTSGIGAAGNFSTNVAYVGVRNISDPLESVDSRFYLFIY